jgi:hypothetical protein
VLPPPRVEHWSCRSVGAHRVGHTESYSALLAGAAPIVQPPAPPSLRSKYEGVSRDLSSARTTIKELTTSNDDLLAANSQVKLEAAESVRTAEAGRCQAEKALAGEVERRQQLERDVEEYVHHQPPPPIPPPPTSINHPHPNPPLHASQSLSTPTINQSAPPPAPHLHPLVLTSRIVPHSNTVNPFGCA